MQLWRIRLQHGRSTKGSNLVDFQVNKLLLIEFHNQVAGGGSRDEYYDSKDNTMMSSIIGFLENYSAPPHQAIGTRWMNQNQQQQKRRNIAGHDDGESCQHYPQKNTNARSRHVLNAVRFAFGYGKK